VSNSHRELSGAKVGSDKRLFKIRGEVETQTERNHHRLSLILMGLDKTSTIHSSSTLKRWEAILMDQVD